MIRNEFVKYFNIRTMFLYFLTIIVCVSFFVAFVPRENNDINMLFNLVRSEFAFFFYPILLMFLVSTMISNEIYSGQLKFFLFDKKNRIKILMCKYLVLIFFMTLFISIIDLNTIIGVRYVLKGEGSLNSIILLKNILKTIISALPLLSVFIFISIVTRNSVISLIALYLLSLMGDQMIPSFMKYSPTYIFREYIFEWELGIYLIPIYVISFLIINTIVFYRKDMLE